MRRLDHLISQATARSSGTGSLVGGSLVGQGRSVKLLVCGYGYVAARVLELAMADPDIDDVYLVTHEPTASWVEDVRTTATRLGVPYTTESVNTADLPFRPDVISSVWYRKIIRRHVIDDAQGRIFNLHPSLLPRHRGCSSVPWAMIEGDTETGVTAHYVDTGIDTGPVLCAMRTPIRPDDTQLSLYLRCMRLAVRLWPQALQMVLDGNPGSPQADGGCEHRRGVPYGGRIDDSWGEAKVETFIRAMTFPPLPPATYRGELVPDLRTFRRLRNERSESHAPRAAAHLG